MSTLLSFQVWNRDTHYVLPHHTTLLIVMVLYVQVNIKAQGKDTIAGGHWNRGAVLQAVHFCPFPNTLVQGQASYTISGQWCSH